MFERLKSESLGHVSLARVTDILSCGFLQTELFHALKYAYKTSRNYPTYNMKYSVSAQDKTLRMWLIDCLQSRLLKSQLNDITTGTPTISFHQYYLVKLDL